MHPHTGKVIAILLTILVIFYVQSCSKDDDFVNRVIDKSASPGTNPGTKEDPDDEAEDPEEETPAEEPLPVETDTTAIDSTKVIYVEKNSRIIARQDAHVQDGQGYNLTIVRLDQARRTSYIMFDLSTIDSVGGSISEAKLALTVNSDAGNGPIFIYKGENSDWNEDSIDENSAPETGALLGSISNEYRIGETIEISLDTAQLTPENTTLVLTHESGDDVAFASKEHPDVLGPELKIKYRAPEDAPVLPGGETPASGESPGTEEPPASGETPDPGQEAPPTSTNEAPVARVGANPLKGPAPLAVTFSGSASSDDNGIARFAWEFKDGGGSTSANPEHTFDSPGEYEVALTVTDEAGLTDSATVTITVEESPAEIPAGTNQAPVARAGASPLKGPAPLEVSFTGVDSSDDNAISSFAWDFKDGGTSTATSPKHTFEKAGQYGVVLTVKDEAGLSGTTTVTIVVEEPANKAPVAKATASPLKGPAPLEVNFTGSGSTDDTGITGYAWDFKDGGGSTSANPGHTFDKAGTYDVVLTVKDEAGLTGMASVSIVVEAPANKAPVSKATASPLSGTLPLEVSFNGSGSTDDTGITGYAWDFKDGGGSTSANPKHTFDAAGTYQVELTVKDAAGLTDVASVSITVNSPANESPKAVAGANVQVGDAPLQVNFSSQGSSDDQGIVSYFWDFDNGDTASGQNPSRTFNNPGIYEVSLTVTDGSGLKGTDTVTITVNQPTSGGGTSGNYPSGAVLASSFGYNSSNATEALENAIRSNNQTIVIDKQSSDWIIEPVKFFDLSNKLIFIESGVVIRAKSGAFPGTNDRLLSFIDANNVTIEGYGATLAMNKSEYGSGEGRHALNLQGVRDMNIKGITIKDSGGDGIYMSRSSGRSYSENVTIEDLKSLNNRRNGMTINSAQDVWVRNSEFSSNKGTQPEAGVDMEPNDIDERLVNINFNGCRFYNNNFAGVKIAVAELLSSSIPISVVISNSEFGNNSKSTEHSKPRTEIFLAADHINPVKGEVRFENVHFNGSDVGVLFSKKTAKAFKTVFRNCVANNMMQSSAVPLIALEAAGSSDSMGGYVFDNFQAQYSRDVPFLRINGPSTTILENITGSFIIKSPYKGPVEYNNGVDPSKGYNIDIKYTHID